MKAAEVLMDLGKSFDKKQMALLVILFFFFPTQQVGPNIQKVVCKHITLFYNRLKNYCEYGFNNTGVPCGPWPALYRPHVCAWQPSTIACL